MHGLTVGASVEGELHLSWMTMFPIPFMPFIFILIDFSFKKLVRGQFPGMVTSGGNVTHKHFTEMRRLVRDETPFLLDMPSRATTLAWWLVAGSVIPLHSHGPNMLARDEAPYPLTRSCFIIFYGSLCFLLRSLLLLSQGSLGEESRGFILWLIYFSNYFYPLGL
jgi:hypothetical protein